MAVVTRNNVVASGVADGQPMVFAHGFGCDQHMWRHVVPAFEDRFRTVVFDHVGFGRSDLDAFDPERHGSLQGYADDLLEVCAELGLERVILVGHSVSAMIALRAAITAPEVFDRLVLVCPSPRYIDDDGYVGGFSEADIDDLLAALDDNYLGWSSAMAPVIMGTPDRPELGEELTNSFCRTDPAIARAFARVTFLSDSRPDLPRVTVPTLVLQSREDVIARPVVGAYVHENIPDSEMVVLDAVGHCPNLSAPDETVAAIEAFVAAPR
ncbi:alpha/beta hydrolase [Iamia sp. SCSIO 61187]|uniref:alpha/beta fold hydrolase n=1 Tax=Iamia sp. SCSIO 61187 TaxID=2722752 RepID=UPI001C639514|nr:alpha/beta hydrolase [Iamia sp. SCSIO 61187]QYG92294.1 alpha/beta hydrolase [Iamia sp. SCSIO 61187]